MTACIVKSLKLKPKVRTEFRRRKKKYFVWLSNFILLERIFSFIYSQAADGGLEFSVLNDGDPTASPSESKPTNTGKLLKIQNSSRTRVEHLIRTRFELPPSNT